mgnify:CR=1 FL=1
MVLHQVPFVSLTIRGPIIGMDPSYEEAARAAGAKGLTLLWRITIPMLSYALASSALLCLVMSLEQFGIPVLIGVPGHIHVLATQVYRFAPSAMYAVRPLLVVTVLTIAPVQSE